MALLDKNNGVPLATEFAPQPTHEFQFSSAAAYDDELELRRRHHRSAVKAGTTYSEYVPIRYLRIAVGRLSTRCGHSP